MLAPTALAMYLPPRLLFPAIWLLALGCLAALLADRTFSRRELWNPAGVALVWRPVLVRFALCAALLTLALAIFSPERLLSLPRERPALWLVIMLGYPVLSVYAQELAFRAFFLRRYAPLFAHRTHLWLVNALAFGYAHVVMHNWLAVGLSVIGGWFFAQTYSRSRSTLAVSLEHGLYGCFLFTIGWGEFFYAGANR